MEVALIVTVMVGQLVGWLIGLCRCRCRCRNCTLGLQLCQAQFSASRSLRPQFISSPNGIITSVMLFLENFINSPTTRPNRLWLSFYLIAKCSRSIAKAVYMSPDLYHNSTNANVFAGSSQRILLLKQLLYHIWMSVYLYLVALHHRQVSPYAILMILWSYDTSPTFSF